MRETSKSSNKSQIPTSTRATEKGGYQPLQEGYSPKRGYTPIGSADSPPPQIPRGGTAQSQKTTGENPPQ
jgi:hypothetical protein